MADLRDSIKITTPIDDKISSFKEWESQKPGIECYDSSVYRISFRLSSEEAIITKKAATSMDQESNLYLPISELKKMKEYLDGIFEVKE